MTERNPETISFSSLGRKKEILADFNGGKITSDKGFTTLKGLLPKWHF